MPLRKIQDRESWARTILSFSSQMLPMSHEPSSHRFGTSTRFENDTFKIRLASNLTRHRSATLLVNRLYSARGYDLAAQSPEARQAPEFITLLVYDATDQPVGTVTIGPDGEAGLLADEMFAQELGLLRSQAGVRLLEITKFAMDRHRGNSRQVVATLLNMAYIYAKWLGYNWMVIEVNPHHIGFYENSLGFRVMGEAKRCPRVNAPAVLLAMDMQHAAEQIRKFGGRRNMAEAGKSLYRYFLSEQDEAALAQDLFGAA